MSKSSIRAYKFYPLDSAIKSLLSSKLKISRLHELNDPFEYDSLRLTNEWDRILWQKGADAAWKDFGFISFCEDWSSPLLWAHYADSHRGLCLGFDIDEEQAAKVNYVREKKALSSVEEFVSDRDDSTMYYALTTKFDDWSYERERRVFCRIDSSMPEHQIQFEPFGEIFNLKTVILGLRCQISVSEIRKILDPPVEIVQACKANSEFKIVSLDDWRNSLKLDGPVRGT